MEITPTCLSNLQNHSASSATRSKKIPRGSPSRCRRGRSLYLYSGTRGRSSGAPVAPYYWPKLPLWRRPRPRLMYTRRHELSGEPPTPHPLLKSLELSPPTRNLSLPSIFIACSLPFAIFLHLLIATTARQKTYRWLYSNTLYG